MTNAGGKWLRVLAASFVLASASARAAASCMIDIAPPCQAFWAADVVFVGTVVEVTYSEKYRTGAGEDAWDRRDRVARFSVEEVFRGEAGADLRITATEILPTPITLPDGSPGAKHISTSDCEYTFKAGERYVVYAGFDKSRPARLRVGLNRSRLAAQAAEDFAFLRGLKSADPSTGRVYGRVLRHERDLKDGNYVAPAPVEGVRVEVSAEGGGPSRSVATDREGSYEVTGLAPGAYVVRTSMPEGLVAGGEQKARVVARGCAQVDFYTQFDGRVAGRVMDADGRAVPELKVDLISADGPDISLKGMWAHTDGEGRYELKGVPPGRYLLGFGLGSQPDARAPFPRTYYPGVARSAQATVLDLGPGKRLELLDLRLPPRHKDRSVEVTVVWPDGRPVEDAMLRLEVDEYWWSGTATRQEKLEGAGRYRVTGFEGLTYWLHAHVNLKGGSQMHAEPARFVMGEGAGPFRLVIASQYGNCPHYLGARNRRQ